jgi:Zn ribbon nucleic-acid-binding protein
MSQIILTKCRDCESEIVFTPDLAGGLPHCPGCKKPVPLRMDASIRENGFVRNCVSCGHDTLYIQKDFNRNLGVAIVVVGSLAALFFFSRSEPLTGFLALFVAAGVDFIIYSVVGDVTVCYSCHTIYRGFPKNPDHGPFELKDLEKYGGRDPRF